jgi:Zn-dependent peptidase ImmA (M78 family)
MSDEDEREANYFAMHLLVPSKMLQADLQGDFSLNLFDDDRLDKLAKKYGVSRTVMFLRIHEEAAKPPKRVA